MFKPQYEDITRERKWTERYDKDNKRETKTPRALIYNGDGLSDSIGDGVMVAEKCRKYEYT